MCPVSTRHPQKRGIPFDAAADVAKAELVKLLGQEIEGAPMGGKPPLDSPGMLYERVINQLFVCRIGSVPTNDHGRKTVQLDKLLGGLCGGMAPSWVNDTTVGAIELDVTHFEMRNNVKKFPTGKTKALDAELKTEPGMGWGAILEAQENPMYDAVYVLPVNPKQIHPIASRLTHVVLALQMKEYADPLAAFYEHFEHRNAVIKRRIGPHHLCRAYEMSVSAMTKFLVGKLLIDVLVTPNDVQAALKHAVAKEEAQMRVDRQNLDGTKKLLCLRKEQLANDIQELTPSGLKHRLGNENAENVFDDEDVKYYLDHERMAIEDEEERIDLQVIYMYGGPCRIAVETFYR